MNKWLIIFIVIFLTTGFVSAHEEEGALIDGIDIHLTPEEAFVGDSIAFESYIKNADGPMAGFSVSFVIDKHDIGLSERVQAVEREPGRYFIKYKFQNSGPHEIHVEFSYNGEIVRQPFDIQVEGGGNASNYFAILALIFLAGSAAYYFRSRKGKASIALAIIS